MINKILITALMLSLSKLAAAQTIDIYPNPNLTDPSLATTFASQLRSKNIKEMERLIAGECNQYKEYVSLSFQNWSSLNRNNKSTDEAKRYSEQLIREVPYRQAFQYTFPLGIQIYALSENTIKDLVNDKLSEQKVLNIMNNNCLSINNTKYYEILTSSKYLSRSQSAFITEDLLKSKFNSKESMFKNPKYVESKLDKLTPPNIEKKLNFTLKDVQIANFLIDDDIKNSFLNSNTDVRWIDYKRTSREMQESFMRFLKEGGKNKNFAEIIMTVEIIKDVIPNYKNLYREQVIKTLEQTQTEVDQNKVKTIKKALGY